MIRLGVCTKPENAELVGRLGFDFIEMSLRGWRISPMRNTRASATS